MNDLRRLIGKSVLLKAGGLTYRGILLEVNLESVILRSPSGHREIPVEKVSVMEELRDYQGDKGGSLPPSPLARKTPPVTPRG